MTLACEIPVTGPAAGLAERISALVPVIETARLRLRVPRTQDFALFHEIMRGPRGIHFGEMTREEAWLDFAQMCAGWMLRGHGAWTIELRDGSTPVGFVLLGLDQEDPEPELGYLLSDAAEGQGIAREAAEAARAFAFDSLEWTSLASFIAPGNSRSIALAERLGAHLDGRIGPDDDPMLVYRHKPEVRA